MLFKKKTSVQDKTVPDNILKSIEKYIAGHSGVYEGLFAPLDKHVQYKAIERVPIGKIEEAISKNGASFHAKLFGLIDKSGLSDDEVWKRADMDRKHFSKIKCNENCKPKKNTVMSLCIALKLDAWQSKDLMARAGLAFDPSSRFDLIVGWAIENKKYDIAELNDILYKFTGETLSR